MDIVALHGFLGDPSDWECFQDLPLKPVYLSSYSNLGFHEFAGAFNREHQNSNILLGYSMGGRLALHCLIHSPNQWKAAIIISSDPGFTSEDKRQERIIRDKKFLNRFENEDFDALMQEWDAQALFNQETPVFKRNKNTLKQSLTEWSLGNQENLREAILQLPMPILWIAGENDKKYSEIYKSLKFLNKKSRVWIAENAFHRVPWEVKIEFQNQVNAFLTSNDEDL